MKKSRLIGFLLLEALNVLVTIHLWDFLAVAALPRYCIGISVCCSGLFLVDPKSKAHRIITYFILTADCLFGAYYAILERRPLGFVFAFSSAVVLIRNFVCVPKCPKENLVTKIAGGVLCCLTAILLVYSCREHVAPVDASLYNGKTVLWDEDSEDVFDEICSGALDEEQKVMAVYHWIIENLEYDEDYYPTYQYFDIRKTLRTKRGICFDYANLFTAICRSQNIPCYTVYGRNKVNRSSRHCWNRVYWGGAWWNVDVTFDSAKPKQRYGFRLIEVYTSPDEEYIIDRIY